MNLYPKICNICGGKVEYISNANIYGRTYGNGFCYRCQKCGAYVGTHVPRPRQALGILANEEMRKMKMACHEIFDSMWRNHKQRERCYRRLAEAMGIPTEECHFGYFDSEQLASAYKILREWVEEKKT